MTKIRVHAEGLGLALKRARRTAGLSQTDPSAKVGLHRNAVVAIEAGRGHIDTLTALADVLGLEVTGHALAGDGPLAHRLQSLRKGRHLGRRTVAAMGEVSVPSIEGVERTGTGHLSTLEAFGRAIGAGLCLVPKGTSTGFWESTATSSADQEWYTPAWLIDRVVRVIGEIDTDPCSPGRGKSAVNARMHFTIKDDGLRR